MTGTPLEYPAATYFKVVARFGTLVSDGVDPDVYPDRTTAGGTVTLSIDTPDQLVRVREPDGVWRLDTISKREYQVRPGAGELETAEGQVGVWLVDTSNPNVDPQNATYTAILQTATGLRRVVTFNQDSAVEGVVDLVAALSMTPSPGDPQLDGRVATLEARVDGLELPTWATIDGKPAVIAEGADAAEARSAIGAVATVNGVAPDGSGNVTIGGGSASQAQALEQLRTLRDFGAGKIRVAVVGDSTGNGSNEWVRLWSQKYGELLPPSVRRTYKSWNGSAWTSETVDAAGVIEGALLDNFSRTGQVLGSTPDIGTAWGGSSTLWVSDGSMATVTPPGTDAVGSLSQNLGTVNSTVTTTLSVVTTTPGSAQVLRIYTATDAALTNGVFFSPFVSTGGGLSGTLYKVIGGEASVLEGTKTVGGQVTNSAIPLSVVVTVTVNGTTVTATTTVGSTTTTWTGTLTEGEAAALGTNLVLTVNGRHATAPFGFSLDKIESAGTGQAANRFEVWNGSIAGATPDTFDGTLRASMFGADPFEVIIVNFGHNGSQSGPQFVTTVSDWLTAWATEHPGSVPLLMSQNPQKPPSGTITAHAARLAALRVWAAEKGYPYVPVWETFRARVDGGASLVMADGIHPTNPPVGTLTGDYGSVLWADTVLAETSADSLDFDHAIAIIQGGTS